ncbi:hypothetical protein FRZ61_24100 [Hypericibacter adhaerens]|uniref:Uncharacterized protein n=2 Tax=Hypericibacter adhaerens TaxID=2602016 RepID=A0A5J6MXS2_9PROT|nr:hypothetical protein FRZ61_24100 [Hypericibacter adhaerens]
MDGKAGAIAVAVLAIVATVTAAKADTGQPPVVQRSLYLEAERSVYLARASEQRGDTMSAAQQYMTAVSLVESTAPRDLNLSKLVLAGEPLPGIGRRMIYYELKLLQEMLAQPQPMMRPEGVLENLRLAYGKMEWLEPFNPAWPYLEAVALAADQDYRSAFQKCREAAQLPGGEESVREKARSLAEHIKPAALAQEQMKEADQQAYMEYVQSGAQALDFAMVSAQVSATEARNKGDTAEADMWDSRYQNLKKQRDQIGQQP